MRDGKPLTPEMELHITRLKKMFGENNCLKCRILEWKKRAEWINSLTISEAAQTPPVPCRQAEKKTHKWFRPILKAYRTLKELAGNFHHHSGFAIVCVPANPCPLCKTELKQCIGLMTRQGYLIEAIITRHKKGKCCQMTADLKKSIRPEEPS